MTRMNHGWKWALSLCVTLLALTPACDKPTPVAPEGAALTISANPSRIDVNGSSTVSVLARKSDGLAVNPGTEVNFATTLGTIDPVAFTNDRGVATATLRGDGRVGTATVVADSGAAGQATLDIQVGSLAGSINLQATPTNVSKDGGTIQLLALVRDDTGAPLPNITVNFTTFVGTLASGGAAILTDSNGEARDTLTVTRSDLSTLSEPTFQVVAEASSEGGALIEAVFDISVGGIAATISLQATPSTIPAGGGSISLVALVRDGIGDPLADAIVNFLTDVGTLSSGGGALSTDSSGQARDTLTASAADLAGFGGTQFNVRVQTAGFGGGLLESVFTVRIQTGTPVACFTTSGTVGGSTVTFNSGCTTGQAPLSYAWDFEDDGSIDSTSQNPSHTYVVPGSHTVRLTVSNALGSDSAVGSVITPCTNTGCN